VSKYYYVEDAIPEKDCDDFLNYHSKNKFAGAKLGDGASKEAQEKHRQSEVQWLPPNNVMVRAVWSYVKELNEHHFKANLTGYGHVQFPKYESNGDNYKWHKDSNYTNDKIQRKLSTVLQLSKPEDYKGGEVQLFNGIHEPDKLPRTQGSLVIFKSEEWHQVTPVVKGTRYSIVMWALGPAYT